MKEEGDILLPISTESNPGCGLFTVVGAVLLGAGALQEANGGLLLFALAVLALGVFIGGVRTRIEVDRSRREIRAATTFFGQHLIRNLTPLSDGDHVHHHHERRGGKNKHDAFVVSVRGPSGTNVELTAPKKAAEGRASAEQLAKFLAMPLHDETSGTLVERAPDQLDLPLAARLNPRETELPAEPTYTVSEWDTTEGRFVVTMPGAGMQRAQWFGMLLVAGIVGSIALAAIANQAPILLLFAFGAGGLLGIPMTKAIALAGAPERLELSESALTITTLAGRFQQVQSIALHELEELEAATSRNHGQLQCMARSDSEELHFGAGLDTEEQTYLVDMLRWAIANQFASW